MTHTHTMRLPDEPDDFPLRKEYISREFTMWCGKCSRWQSIASVNSITAARKVFIRRGGWKADRKYGYVCPGCQSDDPFWDGGNAL